VRSCVRPKSRVTSKRRIIGPTRLQLRFCAGNPIGTGSSTALTCRSRSARRHVAGMSGFIAQTLPA
jgi:hypothetical protein